MYLLGSRPDVGVSGIRGEEFHRDSGEVELTGSGKEREEIVGSDLLGDSRSHHRCSVGGLFDIFAR